MSFVVLGQEQADAVQGGQVLLQQTFETWPGSGAGAPASGVTIAIAASGLPGSGAGTPVPATAEGLASIDGGVNWTYTWHVDPEQTTGDYLITWSGTVSGVAQSYVQAITVAAIPTGIPATGVYATFAQYQAWSGDRVTPQSRVTPMLQRASEDLDGNLVGAVYPVNAAGMPTDPFVINVFMRACCAQCQFLLAGNDPAGIKPLYQSTSMGGVSQTRAAGTTGYALPPLGPRAWQILHTHGALSISPLTGW